MPRRNSEAKITGRFHFMFYENIVMNGTRPTCDVSRNGATPCDAATRIWRPMLMASVGFLGVMAVHHPMILSGFGRIQTDLADTRLLNYFIEHGWLWVSRAPRHERFWDAPFFHPVPNVMAYSDSMLSYGPFYWPLRMAGLPPDTAFGIWMVATTVLNYAAGVLLFSRGLGFARGDDGRGRVDRFRLAARQSTGTSSTAAVLLPAPRPLSHSAGSFETRTPAPPRVCRGGRLSAWPLRPNSTAAIISAGSSASVWRSRPLRP